MGVVVFVVRLGCSRLLIWETYFLRAGGVRGVRFLCGCGHGGWDMMFKNTGLMVLMFVYSVERIKSVSTEYLQCSIWMDAW